MVTPAKLLTTRRDDWHRLENILDWIGSNKRRQLKGEITAELSSLYRSACADLAMADQYRLSPESINYLQSLIARAHSTLYRSRQFQVHQWAELLLRHAPRKIFNDRCVHIAAVLFFGLFALSTFFAYNSELFPGFAERMIGSEAIAEMERSFSEINFDSTNQVDIEQKLGAVAFYINHNTGIGLECFALGPLILPGLWKTAYNATFLGACFGYMARPETPGGDNFLEFVTAHGAFELTAIALAAAAGLRIGTGWIFTKGRTRLASLQAEAREAVPVMSASGVLFFLAAMTEGMLSPTNMPYLMKSMWAIFSSSLLMYYFVVLGYPTEGDDAT